MADKPIEQRVKDIIVEQLGVKPDQVTPEAKFIEDLGADSLDTVELVMALEEEFGIEVPDEQAEKLQSVGDVIKYIEDTPKIVATFRTSGQFGWTSSNCPFYLWQVTRQTAAWSSPASASSRRSDINLDVFWKNLHCRPMRH